MTGFSYADTDLLLGFLFWLGLWVFASAVVVFVLPLIWGDE